MDQEEFAATMMNRLPVGYVFDNPRRGQTKILGYTREPLVAIYLRGRSSIRVRIGDLFVAYDYFRGRRVSSTDLRQFAPSVFDSKARPAGHSCNCTFLFHVLQVCSLIDGDIEGRGVNGHPFYVQIKP